MKSLILTIAEFNILEKTNRSFLFIYPDMENFMNAHRDEAKNGNSYDELPELTAVHDVFEDVIDSLQKYASIQRSTKEIGLARRLIEKFQKALRSVVEEEANPASGLVMTAEA